MLKVLKTHNNTKKEYQYYTDFVKHVIKVTNLNMPVSLLAMSGTAYPLIEIIMSKPHDIDASKPVAADLLFVLFHFADKTGLEIETIHQCIGTQSLKSKVHIKPTPAMKEMVFHQVMHATTEWIGNIKKAKLCL